MQFPLFSWRHRYVLLAGLIVVVGFPFGLAKGENWPQFRGPDGAGVATAKNLPTTWDSQKNIVWKQTLPGPGTSSPIVWGDRIYLTSYSGYAESIDDPGDMEKLVRHVVCLDRKTGKILWAKTFKAKMPESKYRPGNDSKHGYASSTPVTDGEHLYVFFGKSGVYCLDMDGKVVWHADVGSGIHNWGSGTSPVLYKNLVIVNASVESKSLVALNKETGAEVWHVSGIKNCWTSPCLVDLGDTQELVMNLPSRSSHHLTGYDPNTGKKLWYCEGIPDSYTCPTPVTHDGIVYVIGGRRNTAIAVRAGGRGDVTKTRMLWKTNKGSNVASPVYVDGYLYWFHEMRGTAYCLDAKTGKVVYEKRLTPRPGLIYASVTAADGKLYGVSREKGTYVVAAQPEFKQLAVNKFQDDSSRANASIVVVDNQILLRTDKAIYCIGTP